MEKLRVKLKSHTRVATDGWRMWALVTAIFISGCDRAPYMPPPRLVEYPEDDQPAQVVAGAKQITAPAKSAASQTKATAGSSVKSAKGESKEPMPVLVGRDDDDDQVAPQAAVKLSFPADLGQWLPDDFRLA